MLAKGLLHIPAADEAELEDWGLKDGGTNEGPQIAGIRLFNESSLECGVWECGEGGFRKEVVDYYEFCHILAGRSVLESDDGTTTHLAPGSTVLFMPGWYGAWRVHGFLRKTYALVRLGSEG